MTLNINKSVSEDELIKKCLNKDFKGQRELYNRYSGKMMGVCIRYIKDRGEAEAVMVEGFIKVFDKIQQFSKKGSFEAWMRRIMVNESLNYIRRNKAMSLEVDIDRASHEPDYDYISGKIEEQDLLSLIQQLPVGYRTVFNMYAIEGYSHKEIAKMLEISENTSKSQLSRARTWLQQRLKESEDKLKNKFRSYE